MNLNDQAGWISNYVLTHVGATVAAFAAVAVVAGNALRALRRPTLH